MKLRYRGRTDVGKTREHNEDDYGFGEGAQVERYGELLVVCDGMGGHAAGEVASHLGVETIIAAPATSSHVEVSKDDREALGIPEGLIRYSVGIEDADDLIADLEQALAAI